jgi:hypothetical protein
MGKNELFKYSRCGVLGAMWKFNFAEENSSQITLQRLSVKSVGYR